jgi:hypothetical protein
MQSALQMLEKAPEEDGIGLLTQALKVKLEQAKQAKFDNKPLWQQCQQVQTTLAKKQKALETAKLKQIKFQADIESLQKQMLDTDRWIAELSVEVAKLEAECTAIKADDPGSQQVIGDIANFEKQWANLPEDLLIGDRWQQSTALFKKALITLHELAKEAIATAAPVPGEAAGAAPGAGEAAMDLEKNGWQEWLDKALDPEGLEASPEEKALLAKIKQRALDDYEHRDKKAKRG